MAPGSVPRRRRPSQVAEPTAEALLPDELWVQVLSHLGARDLGRSSCACRGFARVKEQAWRAVCFKRWPRWAAISAEPDTQWRRQYELLELRAEEADCVPDVAAIRKAQPVMTERHRGILCEWLCEVSMDWGLDSSLSFKGVAYLDHYLSSNTIAMLGRLQLVGLGCLRAAMADVKLKPEVQEEDRQKWLDPARFAYISDDTYTAAEVEECTRAVVAAVPQAVKLCPNTKMFLRSFWYRSTVCGVVAADEMHVYTLASFLLQLSQLDLECSGFAPSLLAAASLSAALAFFGKPAWPAALRTFGSYEECELAACRDRLVHVQATEAAGHLRPLWRERHEEHSYEEYAEQWKRALLVFSCPSRLQL